MYYRKWPVVRQAEYLHFSLPSWCLTSIFDQFDTNLRALRSRACSFFALSFTPGEACNMFEDSCSGRRHQSSTKGLSQAQNCSRFHVNYHSSNSKFLKIGWVFLLIQTGSSSHLILLANSRTRYAGDDKAHPFTSHPARPYG